MIGLCLTASTARGGFALFDSQSLRLLYKKSWDTGQGLSELIVQNLAIGLKKIKKTTGDISNILLDVGPGSFTGCRIVTVLAKTIAATNSIPIHCIFSLQIIARQNNDQVGLVAVNAHRNLFYVWDEDQKKILLLGKNDLMQMLLHTPSKKLFGDIDSKDFDSIVLERYKKTSKNYPLPQTMALIFDESPKSYRQKPWAHAEPEYIRAPDAVKLS